MRSCSILGYHKEVMMNFFYELISWFGVFIIYGLMFLAFGYHYAPCGY